MYPQVRGFQDLGTKKKRRAREAEPLGMQGGTGGCRPPARGSGGLEAPQELRGVWGRQPPSKNNFVNLKPPSDHLQPLSDHLQPYLQPPSDHLLTTFQPPSTVTIFREKVKPIITPPDKDFELSG